MGPNNRSHESDNAHLESHKTHVDHSTWEDNQSKKIFSDKSKNIEGDQIGGTVREVNNFKNGGNLCFGATCLQLQILEDPIGVDTMLDAGPSGGPANA